MDKGHELCPDELGYTCVFSRQRMTALRKEDLAEQRQERTIFHPAPLTTLEPEKGAHFDLYLAIPSPAGMRYVLYKSSELDLTHEKCNYLIDRGVKNLYIADEDAPAYFEFVDRTLTEKLTSPDATPEKRSRILYTTTLLACSGNLQPSRLTCPD